MADLIPVMGGDGQLAYWGIKDPSSGEVVPINQDDIGQYFTPNSSNINAINSRSQGQGFNTNYAKWGETPGDVSNYYQMTTDEGGNTVRGSINAPQGWRWVDSSYDEPSGTVTQGSWVKDNIDLGGTYMTPSGVRMIKPTNNYSSTSDTKWYQDPQFTNRGLTYAEDGGDGYGGSGTGLVYSLPEGWEGPTYGKLPTNVTYGKQYPDMVIPGYGRWVDTSGGTTTVDAKWGWIPEQSYEQFTQEKGVTDPQNNYEAQRQYLDKYSFQSGLPQYVAQKKGLIPAPKSSSWCSGVAPIAAMVVASAASTVFPAAGVAVATLAANNAYQAADRGDILGAALSSASALGGVLGAVGGVGGLTGVTDAAKTVNTATSLANTGKNINAAVESGDIAGAALTGVGAVAGAGGATGLQQAANIGQGINTGINTGNWGGAIGAGLNVVATGLNTLATPTTTDTSLPPTDDMDMTDITMDDVPYTDPDMDMTDINMDDVPYTDTSLPPTTGGTMDDMDMTDITMDDVPYPDLNLDDMDMTDITMDDVPYTDPDMNMDDMNMDDVPYTEDGSIDWGKIGSSLASLGSKFNWTKLFSSPVVQGALGLGSSIIGSNAAGSATEAQIQAQRDALALNAAQYAQNRADFKPFLDEGYSGLNQLKTFDQMKGLGTLPSYQTEVTNKLPKYNEDPATKAMKALGQTSLQRNLNARGLNYGATGASTAAQLNQQFDQTGYDKYKGDLSSRYAALQGEYATKYGQNSDAYNKIMNSIKVGQGAAGTVAASGDNSTNNATKITSTLGDAAAQGSVAQANIWKNFAQGLGNLYTDKTANTETNTTTPNQGWWG